MQYNLTVEKIDNGYLVTAGKYNPSAGYDDYSDNAYVPPKRRYVQSLEDVGAIFTDLIG